MPDGPHINSRFQAVSGHNRVYRRFLPIGQYLPANPLFSQGRA